MADRPKVIDLAERRLKKLRLQTQAEYIDKLCRRCERASPGCCSESDLRRLADIQRQVILDLLGGEGAPKPPGETPDGPEDERPKD